MKKLEIADLIPNFFENVAHLNATLLIDTANSLLPRLDDGGKDDLFNLEYLFSRLSIFKTSESSDAVYTLLAIAKDKLPSAVSRRDQVQQAPSTLRRAREVGRDLSTKTFQFDYGQEYVDICKDFLQFSIGQAGGARALDVTCRPWAPLGESEKGVVKSQKLPSWIRGVDNAAFEVQTSPLEERIKRINVDPLVGLPLGHRSYSAAGTRKYDAKALKFVIHGRHYGMFVRGFVLRRLDELQE
ncbi:MAG: hypothetical protein Q9170_002717 [Blastenia crenularia]